jgi:SlyX protein
MATDSRLTDLEIRLTHQEAALEEMSRTLIRQERVIEELRDEIQRLQRQLLTLSPSNVASEAEETPPPHY